MPFPKAIITKPFLISDSEYKDLGLNINLVGYDSFSQIAENTKQHVSPRLLNWVEPYEISGERKSLFYTEVNTNFQVGDKVYILNGNYDNDSLIKKDKYKKGRDGYKVLKMDQCKVVLDIDYTGVLPYNNDSFDDYIKIYYIDNSEKFLSANRQVTTRGGNFDYKFNYYQNNIAFIDKNLKGIDGWGLNAGVSGTPGFFVREERQGWSKISDELVYLGSFSVALSPTYSNNGKIVIMDGSFEYNGIQFKEGFVYRWEVGPTSSAWQVDQECSPSIITKSNFRNGTFNGKFNNGLYGTQKNKINWNGKGTWNGGTMVNTRWKSGTIDSKLNFVSTYKAVFDEYGIPFQKSYTNNNGGFGFNYIFDSEIEKSLVNNGNFYNTSFEQAATFSVVENHVLSITQSFDNKIVKANFELCNFTNIQIEGGELKNTRSFNSKISNVKSINSYFEKSVLKDSTYVSDEIIKILGYDEWNMSEYFSSFSGSFSSIKDVNNKIYKFYISKENFKRLKSEDVFYIKGLKINNSPTLTNFFDNKFRLTSWTEFYDDYSTGSKSITGVDPYSFYKRGYECSAFLSTPEENAYVINSYEGLYNVSGATVSKYTSVLSGTNSKAAYSIDIVVSRHDLLNKNQSMDSTSEWDSLNPKNYNYDSDVIVGTTSLPAYLGNNIDISTAYILDSDFDSGIIETSDWNSGHHINYNNDVVITSVTSSGIYNLEIDNYNDYLIAYTNINYKNTENNNIISEGDVLFLNSIDYDTRGMVTNVTIIATGSSYSSSSDPIFLVNTKVESLTMSNVGTYYKKDIELITYNKTGKGTGLTIDVDAKEIGAVLGITYSAPMSGGGSYSMNFNSSVSTSTGPISTSTFVFNILTDDSLGTVTGITPAQNNGNNATYSVFGPPLTVSASGATGVGAIFVTGPLTTSPTGATSCVSLGSGLTLNYKTSTNGSITYLEINNPGSGYEVGQIFKVEGGGATFSIKSVSKGEIISYKINNPGEDYLKGDILEIIKPFDPNFQFGEGITASVVVTSITVSSSDTKGLSLDILAVPGTGYISNISINGPGLYYTEGDIFTINGGNLDALVRIDSVTGSVIRLNDTYKVLGNDRGKIILKDLGVQNIIAGLTARGIFYTTDAKNRWGYLSKTKIDKTKIKSGIFKRSYITNSLIRDINYDSTDRNFNNLTKIKNLVISDSLFSNNSNILSSATYLYSNIVGGTDIWNDGIINKSVINGLTFSKGTIKQSTWIDGNFTGGMFFFSKSFDAKPTEDRPNYLSDRVRSYYMTGELGATLSNNRYSWRNGKLSGGQFYKSDWENGVMNNGLFFYSKFYNGTINGGKIGTKEVSSTDTRVYNGLINYTTVDNAHVYSEDTSFTGLSSSSILWMNGIFNKGVFGSNNDDIVGTTFSHLSYAATFSASMPIADFKITIASQSVTDVNPILGDFEIDVRTTIKHTYLGDLIINLMSPNGKIINLKKRYSCGSNDNLLSTVFSSDSTKPSIEIGTTPYTGTFKFDALLNQGVYYDLNNNLLPNIQYREEGAIIPEVIDYRSQPPATVYEGDRYLVIATASDPNWIAPATSSPYSNPWAAYVGKIVERSSSSDPNYAWELYSVKNNDKLFVKNKSEYLKYIDSKWTKSYHSNTTKILDLLNTDKTVTGNWKMMIMDCAAVDSGFVEAFEITFNYKTSYIIKSFKNDAVWNNGIFNGGQFIDLGVWRNGTFNGGKFISTFGYEKSGSYLVPSKNELEYSWQNGIFNGGEFGNESLLSNSTWYNGEFNDGVFKGKLWNNGVFTYGEFKGGSSVPAIGNGIKSANAQIFMESFKNEYYGVWLSGVVSDKKDNFVTDKKLFTKPLRAMTPVKLGKTAKFTNMLWASGTFNHPSGEIKNSIWLNGLFKMGNFKSSAFNPYVTRRSDKQEFVKDDSCIWENGKLIDSEFHMSKWTYGQFISGTAVGMIWKNGISNYMNAYNIFWENGVWRNGNWYGSNFEYRGKVEDGFAKEILNRGIEWSGTSSCHIWNLFESDVDTTSSIATTSILNAAGDSFTTTNLDDAGYSIPSINNLIITKIDATSVKAEFTIVANGGAPIKEVGFIYTTNTTSVVAANNTPNISVSNQIGTGFSGTTVKATVATPPTYTFTTGVSTTGIPTGLFGQVIITGLLSNLFYTIRGYAINLESNTGGAALTPNMIVFQTVQPNTVTFNSNLMPITTPNLATGEVYSGAGNIWQQGVRKSITISAKYNLLDPSRPAPTGPNSKGIVFYVRNISDPIPQNPTVDANDFRINFNLETVVNFITTIPTTGVNAVVANKVYYIRAFTINASGPGYSDLITITSGVDLPTLGTTTVTTDLTGNLSNTGGSTTIQRGFIISSTNTALTTKPSTIAETSLSGGSGMVRINIDTNATLTSFTKTINTISAGLTPAIQYYVRAYVYNTTYDYDNCNAFAYSNILPFTSAPAAPGVTTNNVVSSITENGANLSGTIVNANGGTITYSGFVYTTTSGSGYPTDPATITTNTVTLGKVVGSGLSGAFTGLTTGLSEGQKYYFKAYATNAVGTTYGEEKSFMTLPLVSALVYNFGGSTDNNSTTTTTIGIIPIFTVTSVQTIVSKGIIWSATNTPANWWITAPTRTTDGATTPLTTGIVGIPTNVSNKKYFVVGYATNTDSNTYYTAPIEVYTKPTFITSTVVTATSSSDGFTITVKEGSNINNAVIAGASTNYINITARGVMWGTPTSWATNTWTNTPALTTQSLAGYSIAIGAGGTTVGVVNPSTTPLVPGTLYYYRPVVTNLGPGGDNAGYYGIADSISVTTLAVVQLPAIGVGGITYDSGTRTLSVIGTAIINTGGQSISGSGLCYITNTPLPLVSNDNIPNPNNNLLSFNTSITFPTGVGTYYIRAYVTNAGGTAYSTQTIKLIIDNAGVATYGPAFI
jgi:subtilisin-like proprotein convertase family protein